MMANEIRIVNIGSYVHIIVVQLMTMLWPSLPISCTGSYIGTKP